MILALLLLAGCARLPDYARPRFHEPPVAGRIESEGFAYRALTVEDFQAAALPPDYRSHDHHINAHSCISIRPAGHVRARITRGIYQGKSFFLGSIPEVRFEAVFVPACSWWNPALPEDRKAYVLQHEQIHFALAELTARRLTGQAREGLKDYLAVDENPEAVQEALAAKLKDLSREAMEASFGEHTAFDEQTSLRYDLRAQRRWWVDVTRRLREDMPP